MAFKDNNGPKKKAYKNKEYFNYYKLGYFRHDYCQPDKKLLRVGGSSIKKHIDN